MEEDLFSVKYEIPDFGRGAPDPNRTKLYNIWDYVHRAPKGDRLRRIGVVEAYLRDNKPAQLTGFWMDIAYWYAYQYKVYKDEEFNTDALLKEFPHLRPMVEYYWGRTCRGLEILKLSLPEFGPSGCCII